MNALPPSRRALLLGSLLPVLLSLPGCKRAAAPSFHGIDLTGATYGQDFRLDGPDGKERTLADFKGRVVMMFFGFTQCPDVCPTALARAAEIKQMLGKDGERLQVLFVTVDPERDVPAVLKAYTAAFDPSFIGLYADLDRTRETADAFKVFYKKIPTGSSYTMDHTALSYVFDTTGQLRLALRHAQSAQECADDLRQILANT